MAACKVDPSPPESGREDAVRACILARVQGSRAVGDQTLSGYVLVHAYLECVEPLQDAQVPEFRTVCQGWVRILPEDPSRIQLVSQEGFIP